MIKGKTKSGIQFSLNEKIKEDARFLYYLTKIQQKDLEETEAANTVMGMLKLVFGTDENVLCFMDEVANKHDGVCDVKSMMGEMMEMLEALDIKNSQSSPR